MKRYDKYKESGISWIGEIPEHWEVRKIKYVFTERSEKGYPNEPVLCSTQKYGVIPQSIYENRVVEVNKGHEGLKLVKEGNFVISLRSFQGGIEYAYYRGIISAAYTVLELNHDYSSEYLRYLLKSFPFIQLLQTCVTGIREGQNINFELLRKNFLLLPPPPEQETIVAYLEEKVAQMDNLVAKREAQIAYLRELKQAVIAKAVTRGINPEVPLRPSGIPWIGDIPEHWEVKRLKSLLCKTFSGEWGNEPTATNAYRCIRIADFDANLGSVFFRTEPTFRSYTRDDIQDKQVLNGDVLLEKSGGGEKTPVGRAVIWNTKDVNNPCMCANFIQVLRTKLEVLQPNFLMLLLSTIHAKDAVKLYIKQTIGIQNLTLKSYMIQPIPLPPSSEQEAIVTYINRKTEEIDRLIAMTEQEIARVRELKQTVIADVVTGRINVQPS